MVTLLGKYLGSLRRIVKISLPLALLAGLLSPLYGYLVRWPTADQALLRYQDQVPVMVGASYRCRSTSSGRGVASSVYRERVYILFPSMLGEPKTVIVNQTNEEPYKLYENRNGVYRLLATYSLLLFGTWWFWLRKPARR
jgi:hypothetical protein